MLIYEAALRSGVGNIATPALGRPGCAVLPMAINSGASAVSFGCKGNRTFTGLPDEEMYLAIPGAKWDAVVETLRTIANANAAMEAHYKKHEATVRGVSSQRTDEASAAPVCTYAATEVHVSGFRRRSRPARNSRAARAADRRRRFPVSGPCRAIVRSREADRAVRASARVH